VQTLTCTISRGVAPAAASALRMFSYATGACSWTVCGLSVLAGSHPVIPASVMSREDATRGVTATWLYVGGGSHTPSGLKVRGFVDPILLAMSIMFETSLVTC
jgi:hypothetical protein